MKLNYFVTTTLLATSHSFGAAGIYDSFLFTTTTGSAPLNFYDIGAVTVNPDFQNSNLGIFQLTDNLRLGGQEKSSKDNGTDVTSHSLFWRVWLTSAGASGSFASVNMPFQWNKGDFNAPSGLNNAG